MGTLVNNGLSQQGLSIVVFGTMSRGKQIESGA